MTSQRFSTRRMTFGWSRGSPANPGVARFMLMLIYVNVIGISK